MRGRSVRLAAVVAVVAGLFVIGLVTAGTVPVPFLPAESGHGTSAVRISNPARQSAAQLAACKITADSGQLNAGHSVDPNLAIPARGAIALLMVVVDFPDRPASAAPDGFTSPRAYYDAAMPKAAAYVNQVSGGRARLAVTLLPKVVRLPRPSTAYPSTSGEAADLVLTDLTTALSSYKTTTRFAGVTVMAVRGQTAISRSVTYTSTGATGVLVGRQVIGHVSILGADTADDPDRVFTHETLHMLGLPDLYVEKPARGDDGLPVGGWDIMSDENGAAPHLLGWQAWKLGWLADSAVRCLPRGSTRLALSPVEAPAGVVLVVVPVSRTRVLVLESRRRTGVDAGACATGVLAYTVDSTVRSGAGPIRLVTPTPKVTGDCTRVVSGRDFATLSNAAGHVHNITVGRVSLAVTSGSVDVVAVTVR